MDIVNRMVLGIMASFRAGHATARNLLSFVMEEMGRFVGKYVAGMMLAGAVVLGLFGWWAASVQSYLNPDHGNFGAFRAVILLAVFTIVTAGVVTLWLSQNHPRLVPYTLNAILLVGGTSLSGVVLLSHSLAIRNESLFFIATGMIIVSAIEAEIYFRALAWLVLKISQLVETSLLAIGGPLVALPPGITLEDVRGRLAPVFDLIKEQLWFEKIKGVPSKILVIALTYLLIISFNIGIVWATAFAIIYFVLIAWSWLALKNDNEELVRARTKNFYRLAFTWAVVLTVIRVVDKFYFDNALSQGFGSIVTGLWCWTSDVAHGRVTILTAHAWYEYIGLLFVLFLGLGVAGYVWRKTNELDHDWVRIGIRIVSLLVVFIVLVGLTNQLGFVGNARGVTVITVTQPSATTTVVVSPSPKTVVVAPSITVTSATPAPKKSTSAPSANRAKISALSAEIDKL